LRFEVRDTGIGIPHHVQRHIFGAFDQADNSTTRQYGGTGLGLTISAQLVEMMGGNLEVKSNPGQGSTFFFEAAFCCQPENGSLVSDWSPQLKDMPVLVVDDNGTNRRIFEEMLIYQGMKPAAVESGEVAFEELLRAHRDGQPYPLVLLDAEMPVMDGYVLAQKIACDESLKETQIIMLTSAGRSEGVKDLLAGRLLKPVKQSDLFNLIADLFGGAPGDFTNGDVKRERPVEPLRILLAEDGLVNQHVAVDMLTQRGHTVVVANNGREALDSLESGDPFGLILMDVQMPVMDGFETTAAIREQELQTGKHIPILAMTADVMKGDRERCLAAGMDGYVAKPLRSQALFDAVENVPVAPRALDWASSLQRVDGDATILHTLAEMFIRNKDNLMARIDTAVAAADSERLRLGARELRENADLFFAHKTRAATAVLEEVGKTGVWENVDDYWENTKREVDCLMVELGNGMSGDRLHDHERENDDI
ncbi:MAG: response regulator, partial [Candidatus Latescibacteria bacterium]|nr:response regulator [Candidatus Latescibacterota bacterium]